MATVTVKSGTAEQLLAEQHDIELREFLLEIGASKEEAECIVAKARAQVEKCMQTVIDPNWKPN
jgi:hypothetical protein